MIWRFVSVCPIISKAFSPIFAGVSLGFVCFRTNLRQFYATRVKLSSPKAMNYRFQTTRYKFYCVCMAFDGAESPHALLREAWRVLAPEGLILLVVPNRWGLWRYGGSTPFSRKYAGCLAENHAQGFSESELCRMLEDHLLTPEICQTALMWPPVTWPLPDVFRRYLSPRKIYRLTIILEKFLQLLLPSNGGVVICLARKRQNQPIGSTAPALIRFFPTMTAQPAKNLFNPTINVPKPPAHLR